MHHDDDLAHFLMARWSRVFPEYLLHFWARPGFTVPYAAVANIGSADTAWHLCRLLSAVLTGASAVLTAQVAARWGVRPGWAVVVAYYALPMTALLACTTLTETTAAFYLAAALWLGSRGRVHLAAVVFSIALVTRYDLAVLVPAWWLWGTVRATTRAGNAFFESRSSPAGARSIPAIVLTLWAPLAYVVLLWAFFGTGPWKLLSHPTGSSEYLPGGLLAYVPQALLAIPPLIFALSCVGAGRLICRNVWLPAALAGLYLGAHVVLRAAGWYASAGYARFLVAISPVWAVLAIAGFARPVSHGLRLRQSRGIWWALAGIWMLGTVAVAVECRGGRLRLSTDVRNVVLCVGAAMSLVSLLACTAWPVMVRRAMAGVGAVAAVMTFLVQWSLIVRPLRVPPHGRLAHAACDWIAAAGLDDRPLLAATPWVAYRRGFVESPRIHKGPRLAASMPIGSLALWDAIYSPSDYHALPLSHFAANPAYRERHRWPGDGDSAPAMVLFEKISATMQPDADPPIYPPHVMPQSDPQGWYYVREDGAARVSRPPG